MDDDQKDKANEESTYKYVTKLLYLLTGTSQKSPLNRENKALTMETLTQ